jgi:hypothetical protein
MPVVGAVAAEHADAESKRRAKHGGALAAARQAWGSSVGALGGSREVTGEVWRKLLKRESSGVGDGGGGNRIAQGSARGARTSRPMKKQREGLFSWGLAQAA